MRPVLRASVGATATQSRNVRLADINARPAFQMRAFMQANTGFARISRRVEVRCVEVGGRASLTDRFITSAVRTFSQDHDRPLPHVLCALLVARPLRPLEQRPVAVHRHQPGVVEDRNDRLPALAAGAANFNRLLREIKSMKIYTNKESMLY
jgi:hypothetical protein